jgi:hypothetical protein
LQNPALDKHVRSNVERELALKGFHVGRPDAADFLVGYHLGIKSSLEVIQMNESYGYAPGSGGSLDGEDQLIFNPALQQESYVRKFKQGSLVIDMVDAISTNLLWRGSAEAEVHEAASEDLRFRRLGEAVRKILKTFPPK